MTKEHIQCTECIVYRYVGEPRDSTHIFKFKHCLVNCDIKTHTPTVVPTKSDRDVLFRLGLSSKIFTCALNLRQR